MLTIRISYIFTCRRRHSSVSIWNSESSYKNLYCDSWRCLDSGNWLNIWSFFDWILQIAWMGYKFLWVDPRLYIWFYRFLWCVFHATAGGSMINPKDWLNNLFLNSLTLYFLGCFGEFWGCFRGVFGAIFWRYLGEFWRHVCGILVGFETVKITKKT